jgi:excisionase family DNA binding protein
MSEWISTTEAARLVGVGSVTIRKKIRLNEVPARREGPVWLIDAAALDDLRRLVAAERRNYSHVRPKPLPITPTGHRAMQLLADWGSGTSEELALVIEVNSGNVRKGLAIAEKLAFAIRNGSDWSLTDSGRQWLTEHPQEVAA